MRTLCLTKSSFLTADKWPTAVPYCHSQHCQTRIVICFSFLTESSRRGANTGQVERPIAALCAQFPSETHDIRVREVKTVMQSWRYKVGAAGCMFGLHALTGRVMDEVLRLAFYYPRNGPFGLVKHRIKDALETTSWSAPIFTVL